MQPYRSGRFRDASKTQSEIPLVTGRFCGAFPSIGRTLPFRYLVGSLCRTYCEIFGASLCRLPDWRGVLQLLPALPALRLAFRLAQLKWQAPLLIAHRQRSVPAFLDSNLGSAQSSDDSFPFDFVHGAIHAECVVGVMNLTRPDISTQDELRTNTAERSLLKNVLQPA